MYRRIRHPSIRQSIHPFFFFFLSSLGWVLGSGLGLGWMGGIRWVMQCLSARYGMEWNGMNAVDGWNAGIEATIR